MMGGPKREKRVGRSGCAGCAKIPPGLLRAGRCRRCRSVAVGPAAARPDQAEGLAAFVIEEIGVDRRGEARIVELDREVIAALAGALRPGGADLGAADKDPVAWRVVAGPVGLRNNADAFGLDAEGDDLALELVAGLLEGTDGCHVVSPWLFEPATTAASMAIDRPQAIDDAPLGAGAQRRMAAERLSCLARNGRSPGEESLTAAITARRSRLCRPAARSSHQEAARVARQTATVARRRGKHGPRKRPGSVGEGTETLAYKKAVATLPDQERRSCRRHGAVGGGHRRRPIEAPGGPRSSRSAFALQHPPGTQPQT